MCITHPSHGSFRFSNDTNSLGLPTLGKSQRSSTCRDPGHHGKSCQGKGAETAAIIPTFESVLSRLIRFLQPCKLSRVGSQRC